MHILFLTDNFPPEVNAPASRTHEHAREWVRAGHKVTVITCAPNFPGGKLFAGYRNRLYRRESLDGIEIVRVWSYITANEGFIRRSLDYASFMASATLAAPFACRPDIVVATSPQFFTAVAGYMVSRTLRVPFVFELRDLWPESIRAVGAMRSASLLAALEWLERFLYRKADAIVSVTHSFRQNLVGRQIDGARIHVVTNGADLSRFRPRPRDCALARSLGIDGCFTAGYVGTHGMAHALDTVLAAAGMLTADGVDDIRIILLGAGAEKARLVDLAHRLQLANVLFLDSVSREQVARYWSLLDASIIHLRDTELFSTVIPSKLFESMAMGVPVLHGVRGESARIVEESDAGLVFEPENAGALAARLRELAGNTVLRARLAKNGPVAAARYDRAELAGEMRKILENTVQQARLEIS
jgi:glycosyltransferase involved in cell wall biosynthesis